MTRRVSRRSRVVAGAAKAFVRPLAEVVPPNSMGVRFTRVFVAATMFVGSPPPYRADRRRVRDGDCGVRGEWVHPRVAPDRRRAGVVLYVHGSGYAICSAATHRGLVARLARATGMSVFSVDYRLAPEHRFPSAADDVERAYRWLLDAGYAAEQIAVAGDSAGGHLLLDLLAENTRHGRPQPAAAVMMSPLIDLGLTLAARRERRRPDPIISARRARQLVGHYIRDTPGDLPRLALTLDRARDLPPTLIQVGGREMLLDDAVAARDLLDAAGARCTLQVWPGQMHVFQAFPRLVPEADRALREAAEFITRALTEPREEVADVRLAT